MTRWMRLAGLAAVLATSAGCPQEIPPNKEEPVPSVETGRIEPEASRAIDPGKPDDGIPSDTAGQEPGSR